MSELPWKDAIEATVQKQGAKIDEARAIIFELVQMIELQSLKQVVFKDEDLSDALSGAKRWLSDVRDWRSDTDER